MDSERRAHNVGLEIHMNLWYELLLRFETDLFPNGLRQAFQ